MRWIGIWRLLIAIHLICSWRDRLRVGLAQELTHVEQEQLLVTLNHVQHFRSPQCKYLHTASMEYVTQRVISKCDVARETPRLSRNELADRGGAEEGSMQWLRNCSESREVPLTDIVRSDAHKFVYVDVVKSGSASIRNVLDKNGDYWGDPWWSRTKSALITRGKERTYFIWSMVRDPITRFLSSVQQAMFRDICDDLLGLLIPTPSLYPDVAGYQANQQKCFDACIHKLLEGEYVDEHFESQLRRLSGVDRELHAPNYSYIGKLEEIGVSWPLLYRRLYPDLPMRSLPHQQHAGPPLKLNIKGWHIRALCSLYSEDFLCFNYEFPRICQDYARPGAFIK